VALAVSGIASFALGARALPGDAPLSRPSLRIRTLIGAYAPLLRHTPIGLTYGAQLLRGVCWSGMLAYVGAFIVEELGYSVQLAGVTWTILGPAFLIGSLVSGGQLRRYDPRLTFIVAVIAMGVLTGVAFAWQPGIVVVFALLFLASLAGGIAEVVAATILVTETPAPQGPTMVLHAAMLRLGSGGGALIGGALLASGGYAAIGAGLPLVALAAAGLAWRSRRAAGVVVPQPEVVLD
jgi:predicted MFS family arabinose efflux permease